MQLNVIFILSNYLKINKTSNYIEQTKEDSPQNTNAHVTTEADNPIRDNNQIQDNTNTQIHTQDTGMQDESKATVLGEDAMQPFVDQSFHQSTSQQEEINDQSTEAVKKSQDLHENAGTMQSNEQKENTLLAKTDIEDVDLATVLFKQHRFTDFKKQTRLSVQDGIETVLNAQYNFVTRILLKEEQKIKTINFDFIKTCILTPSHIYNLGSSVFFYNIPVEQNQDCRTACLSNSSLEINEPLLTEAINALSNIYSFLIKDKKTVEAIHIDYFFMFWHAFQELFTEKKLNKFNNLKTKTVNGIEYDSSIVLYLNYLCMFFKSRFVYKDTTMHISPNTHLKLFNKAIQALVNSYELSLQQNELGPKSVSKGGMPNRLTNDEKKDAIEFFTTCAYLRRTMYLQCMHSSLTIALDNTGNPLTKYFIGITALDTIMLFMNIAINCKNIITGSMCTFFTLNTALIEDLKEFKKEKIHPPDSFFGKATAKKTHLIKVEDKISSVIVLKRTLLNLWSLITLPVFFNYDRKGLPTEQLN